MPRLGERQPLLPPAAPSPPGGRYFILLGIIVVLYFGARAAENPVTNIYIFDQISKENEANITASHPCRHPGNTTNRTLETKVQEEVAEFNKYLTVCLYLPALLPTLLLGSLIDRVGRRRGLLVPIVGTILRQTVSIVILRLKLSRYYLLLATGLEAICGGFATMLMVAFGIIADLSPAGQSRTFRISLLEAFQAIASALGGFAASQAMYALELHQSDKGLLYSMVAAAGISSIAFIIAGVFFPETLLYKEDLSRHLVSIKSAFLLYLTNTLDSRRRRLNGGMVIFVITVAVNFSSLSLMPLYLQRPPLCWDQFHVYIFTSGQIIVQWLLLLVIVKILLKWLGLKDLGIGTLGCVSSFVSLTIAAFSTKDFLVYLGSFLGTGIRSIIPMTRSYMSHQVDNEEQGALFAGMGCIEMITAAVFAFVANKIYSATVHVFPGLIFLIFAAVMVFAAILFSFMWYNAWRGHTRFNRLRTQVHVTIQNSDSLPRYDEVPPDT